MRLAFISMLLLGAASQATAEPYRQPYLINGGLPEPEKIGCYWFHEREYCSRYCYWEINGKRYCQVRERDASTQAPLPENYDALLGPVEAVESVEAVGPAEPLVPPEAMKLGVAPRK